MNSHCLFCKIVQGDIPSEAVFEDDSIRAFKDVHPKAPVHILVVPKKHIDSIQTLTDGDRETILDVLYGAKAIAEKIGLEGYKLVFNVGRKGGQVIDHIHLHILGGWDA